jgi:aromatic ring-cleaving dioxygenase
LQSARLKAYWREALTLGDITQGLRGAPPAAQQMVPVRFSTDQHAQLREWCAEHGFSMATVIRGLVARFLEGQLPDRP